MSSSCKSSIDCVDPHGPGPWPVRATYVSLYGWPESDAEFMRSVTRRREAKSSVDHRDINTNNRWIRRANSAAGPAVVDSYSCRQTYLRSYTFSRKESTRERTRRCFVRVREKVSLLALLLRRRMEKRGWWL